jgi:hypothetical protein
MPFQIVGMAVVGFAGGFYKRYSRNYGLASFCVEVGILGAFLTEIYDLITNLGVAVTYMITGINPPLAVTTALAYGTPFSLIHVVSNIFVFGAIFFPLSKALNKLPMVKSLG